MDLIADRSFFWPLLVLSDFWKEVGWGSIIYLAVIAGIDQEMYEACDIDGAGYFRIFVRIYFPISLPMIAAIALFAGVAQWNSWFDTVYFTRSEDLETLQAVLLRIIKQSSLGSFVQEWRRCRMRPWPTISIPRACSSRPCW